jgi:N-acyl-phosphatidylethanolamine-hydrolysing phospholipase D
LTKPSHHTARGFRNLHSDDVGDKSLGDVLRWRWNAARHRLPGPPATPIPRVEPDLALVHAHAPAGTARAPAVTWIGHATALVQAGGLNALVDPVFSERASPLPFLGPKRHHPPGLSLQQLPHIDLVLVSHNHYDHLDEPSAMALASQAGGPPVFVVPLGLKAWLGARGIRTAVELDWWQSHRLGEVEVVLVPAQHWSARGLSDRMKTLWGGFAVFSEDLHWFYAGDTGYSRSFADIRSHFAGRQHPQAGGGFDLALLPIGAYAPRWFMAAQHVDVEEALRIHGDLGAKRSLGVHWGTFELTDEPLDEPPRTLAAQRPLHGVGEDEFFTLAIGETRQLPPRQRA